MLTRFKEGLLRSYLLAKVRGVSRISIEVLPNYLLELIYYWMTESLDLQFLDNLIISNALFLLLSVSFKYMDSRIGLFEDTPIRRSSSTEFFDKLYYRDCWWSTTCRLIRNSFFSVNNSKWFKLFKYSLTYREGPISYAFFSSVYFIT